MKKFALIVLTVLLVSSGVFAEDVVPVDEKSVNQALTVVVDCLSAAIASNYSANEISMPSTIISVDQKTNLPQRIAFLLADPSAFVATMQSFVGNSNQNLFVSLMSLITKSVTDPLVSAAYFAMASREYKQSDYLISGFVSFSYPENATLEELTEIWVNRSSEDGSLGLSLDLSIFGNKMQTPVDISGNFEISVDKNGSMVISSIDSYSINGLYFTGGLFRF